MEFALAIITALGSLIGLIAFVVKRRDEKKKERDALAESIETQFKKAETKSDKLDAWDNIDSLD